eukprot:GILK01008620.1.p1 GENE.GILK01008620.1~~GILK01008620.1.p1  ORF type:complete len:341 (+),score=68.50 GILK01008620.1:151-1173(+)
MMSKGNNQVSFFIVASLLIVAPLLVQGLSSPSSVVPHNSFHDEMMAALAADTSDYFKGHTYTLLSTANEHCKQFRILLCTLEATVVQEDGVQLVLGVTYRESWGFTFQIEGAKAATASVHVLKLQSSGAGNEEDFDLNKEMLAALAVDETFKGHTYTLLSTTPQHCKAFRIMVCNFEAEVLQDGQVKLSLAVFWSDAYGYQFSTIKSPSVSVSASFSLPLPSSLSASKAVPSAIAAKGSYEDEMLSALSEAPEFKGFSYTFASEGKEKKCFPTRVGISCTHTIVVAQQPTQNVFHVFVSSHQSFIDSDDKIHFYFKSIDPVVSGGLQAKPQSVIKTKLNL